jgi:hypothetical protein
VIYPPQDRNVQITAIARNKVSHDLATSIRQKLITAGEALQDHVDVFRTVIFEDQVMPWLELSNVSDSVFQHLPVLLGQPSAILKLQDERGGHDHLPSPEGDPTRPTRIVAMRDKSA